MSVNKAKKNLNLFFNCKKESVEAVLESPIPSNKAEASFSQNMLDNLGMPNELYFELHRIKDIQETLGLRDPEAMGKINEYADTLKGTTLRFVKDPVTLSQLDLGSSKVQ